MSSSTRSMYMTERADFGLQALRSLAEPVASTRWEIFFHRTQLPVFQRVCGHYLLCSVTLLMQRLHPHFVGQRLLTHIRFRSCSLKTCFVRKLSKFINKELVVLVFTNPGYWFIFIFIFYTGQIAVTLSGTEASDWAQCAAPD